MRNNDIIAMTGDLLKVYLAHREINNLCFPLAKSVTLILPTRD